MERFYWRPGFADAKDPGASRGGSIYRVEDVSVVNGNLTTTSGTTLSPLPSDALPTESPIEPTPLPLLPLGR